ncbi:putative catechol 1,2-dioxygenase [Calycina marina]|uniref:Catechol 1,2-dioxygenase n=1 Tax=Calycina marina TaxID=1763456 RepID=A0A9P8CCF1_9HELO|nr:putative catechol 1,2-dioxygenase [Calycina marina]
MAGRFDPNFTQHCIDTIGPTTADRQRVIFSSLIKHLHDFAREVELSVDEWMIGVHFVNTIGKISTPTRNEAHRMCDVLGLESSCRLVDEIAHKLMTEDGVEPTSSSILGPFWSPDAPFREMGANIAIDPAPLGKPTYMHGQVTDLLTGKGIPNAVFDIWQASANGKYDFQDPDNQSPNNLRGKFRTDDSGNYHFYCLKPTAYSLPIDGPAGVLLNVLDRHPMRPAHIHLMVRKMLPTDDPYLSTDTVFAVKDDLVVDFTPRENDPKAGFTLEYNVKLAPKGYGRPGTNQQLEIDAIKEQKDLPRL